jgi:hypothetical protein
MLLSLVISTIAFFVAGYYIKRWADNHDIPKGMTRNIGIFVLAVALAYGVAWVVDKGLTMRLVLVASIVLLAACAEAPRVGITISNTPAPIGACAPPKPGAGCP